MRWTEIRQQYPDQWLIIDALEAHTEGNRRKLDQITVVEVCPDGAEAFQRYRELHRQYPLREFYFVHTAREELDIRERHWLGLRRNYAACVDRLQVGSQAVEQFEIEVGGMDDAFAINGIIGMDFLLRSGAVINLGTLRLDFPRKCRGEVEI